MNRFRLILLIAALLVIPQVLSAQQNSGFCIAEKNITATGRVLLLHQPKTGQYGSGTFSYYLTGTTVTAVNIRIEAGHVPAATAVPAIVIAAVTTTGSTQVNMGSVGGIYTDWYAYITTLTGTGSPTIHLNACFFPGNVSKDGGIGPVGIDGPTGPTGPSPIAAIVDVGFGAGNVFQDEFNDTTISYITAGETVQWKWVNGLHTVVSISAHCDSNPCAGLEDGLFDSGDPNSTVGHLFSYVFLAPGTYYYYCDVHGQTMQGSVIVHQQRSGFTGSGTSCTVTAIVAGIVTAASCI